MSREAPRSDRLLAPVLLTAFVVALGAVILFAFGTFMTAVYAVTVPVGLFLLWISRDVPTLEERLAELEPAPSPARAPRESPRPAAAPLEGRHA